MTARRFPSLAVGLQIRPESRQAKIPTPDVEDFGGHEKKTNRPTNFIMLFHSNPIAAKEVLRF